MADEEDTMDDAIERVMRDAEWVGCLQPNTPYTQGPDPSDEPVPCGECPLCLVVEQRDGMREALERIGWKRALCGVCRYSVKICEQIQNTCPGRVARAALDGTDVGG